MSGAPMLALDHVVVGAATLAQGVAWCRRTFGIEPAGGGEHGFMATHNRLFSIAGPRFPRAYLEVIAVDPLAPAPGRTRWFDLDRPDVRAALDDGPRLLHWVARCPDVAAVAAAWRAHGVDPGEVIVAERATPHGPLRWRITVPADGGRAGEGAVPTLIEWGADGHPADRLAPSGVTLQEATLSVACVQGATGLVDALKGSAVTLAVASPAPIVLQFETPLGPVRLASLVLGS